MTIEGFTPVSALVGGALIGLAATALYAATGRIAGISGIAGSLFRVGAADAAWRLLFLAGLVVGAGAAGLVGGMPVLRIEASWPMLVLAGLLVGYGTQYLEPAQRDVARVADGGGDEVQRAGHVIRA